MERLLRGSLLLHLTHLNTAPVDRGGRLIELFQDHTNRDKTLRRQTEFLMNSAWCVTKSNSPVYSFLTRSI